MNNLQDDMDNFNCQFCDYSSRHFFKLIKHLKHVHAHLRDFKVTCGINECRKSYKMVRKLVNHIRCKHKHFAEHNLQYRRNVQNAAALPDDEENDVEEEDEELIEEPDPPDYDQLISNIFLEAREEYKISGKACEFVGQELKTLMEKSVCEQHGQLSEALGTYSVPRNFQKIAEMSSNFIKPCEVVLGMKTLDQVKPDTYQYVPIIPTLKALLKHDDIIGQVLQGHQSNNGNISSFTDGELYTNNAFLLDNPTALQIYLYYDDFQVSNPLRNRRDYKLAGFYFLLGNLDPKYRSKQNIVQLACLCKSADLKHYGLEAVLSRLIADIKTLEAEGIQFTHDDRQFHFYGTLVLVLGDNLAQHLMGGFPQNFSTSLRLCRFCTGERELVKTSITETDFSWRTREAYDQQANTVAMQPQLASVYGVKKRSPLNQLQHFHVVGSMPSDIAHDLFEGGVVSNILAVIICQLVNDRRFTLSDLNRRIRLFDYADCDKSNPIRPLPDQIAQFKIKSTISETWLLLRMLPLLIGDMVPEEDDVWGVFLDMIEMVDRICARSYLPGEIAHMAEKITEFHENYHDVFEARLKPKEHFTLHYEKETKLFGPLIACSTNMWERKHNLFKQIANRSKNRRNICLTLAMRHQYYQYLQYERLEFIDTAVQYVNAKSVRIQTLSEITQNLLAPLIDQEQQHVNKASAIVVNGVKYSKGSTVILSYEDDKYKFGQIQCAIYANGKDYLLCAVLQTVHFNKHFHAYEVVQTPALTFVEIENLLDYHPLGVYQKGGKSFIVLKHFVSPDN